jgi:arylsulfatase A-like enzyme
LLLVTADHGEALGELGHQAHGTSLRETMVRIPFVAWSPGKDPRRFVPGQLPAAPSELGPFVASVLGGPAFEPATAVSFATDNPSYPQIGIHHDGWKLVHHLLSNYDELYQLATDPDERNNRAQERPDLVRSLGRLLGQKIVTDQWLYDLVARVTSRASGGGLLQEEDHRQAVEAGVR